MSDSGERGPKGDHGQHGDEGATGATGAVGEQGRQGREGLAGERGMRGDVGSTGQPGTAGTHGKAGERGPANWRGYIVMAVAVIAAFAVFVWQDNRRQHDTARTTLENCLQIEVVKSALSDDRRVTIERLPGLSFYQRRPDEAERALRDAEASLKRFRANDCYDLPTVRAAEIKRPR